LSEARQQNFVAPQRRSICQYFQLLELIAPKRDFGATRLGELALASGVQDLFMVVANLKV